MNKQIVYIAYLIVFFVIFNFAYGFTDWIGQWQMWHWYLVVLGAAIGGLLYVKLKQNERKITLSEQIREMEKVRMQLSQLLLYEQLKNLDDSAFGNFLKQVYELKGYHSIETAPKSSGYDLVLWKEGMKSVVKWFKTAPLMSHQYKEKTDFSFESGEAVHINQLRETFGAMQDYDVQADNLVVISTSFFDEEAQKFAARNGIELMNGEAFYDELETLREPMGTYLGEALEERGAMQMADL